MRVGQRGLGHASERLARTRGLPVLLVSGNVEQDEEDEVGAQDTNAGESGKLLSSAFTSVRHVGEVSGGEVGVRGEVDEACAIRLVIMTGHATPGGCWNIPRSMMNWTIWRRVTHSFHQILTPRALWK